MYNLFKVIYVKDVVIIFKRKKFKDEYKLEPCTFLLGDVSNDMKIFVPKKEFVENISYMKEIQYKYSFANDIDSLNDRYVFGFPLSINTFNDVLKNCIEADDELDLGLGIGFYAGNKQAIISLSNNYFESIDKYLYYQKIINNNIRTYTVNKQVKEMEAVDLGVSSYRAVGEAICGEAREVGEYIIQMLCENDIYSDDDNLLYQEVVSLDSKKDVSKKVSTNINSSVDIDVSSLYSRVTNSLRGQNDQVKDVISAIDINQRINNPRLKQNILICGDTGVGKTELFRLLSKDLNIPMVVEDATQYTMAGYVGKSVDEMLAHLLASASDDIGLAERGILVVDEIDKKASMGANEKVATAGVLESLLKLMEGGSYCFEYKKRDISLNTTNMTFVAMGAFSGLREQVISKEPVGFNKDYVSKRTNPYSTDNFNKYGLLPEFIGRCNNKIIMNPMTIDILTDILNNSSNSPMLLTKELFSLYGVDLVYDDEVILAIAKQAQLLKTGARSLFEIMFNLTKEARFEVQSNRGKYKKLVLSKDMVHDNRNYVLK